MKILTDKLNIFEQRLEKAYQDDLLNIELENIHKFIISNKFTQEELKEIKNVLVKFKQIFEQIKQDIIEEKTNLLARNTQLSRYIINSNLTTKKIT